MIEQVEDVEVGLPACGDLGGEVLEAQARPVHLRCEGLDRSRPEPPARAVTPHDGLIGINGGRLYSAESAPSALLPGSLSGCVPR